MVMMRSACWTVVLLLAGCTDGGAINGNHPADGGGGCGDCSAGDARAPAAADAAADASPGGEPPPPAARGATVPYREIEAEAAATNGVPLGPSTTFGDVAAEASGRRAVRLEATGQYVRFALDHAANSIVVRYSIPDVNTTAAADPVPPTPTSTLGLYVNGVRKASLVLTSRYAWTYGDADAQGAGSNSPGGGTPHHFYDEAHLLFDRVPAGATVALQKDGQDAAAYYVVDLVDFEDVAPPQVQPAGSLSIADFGATPDDSSDDGPALLAAIAAARAQHKVLWIPRGTFEVRFDGVTDVTRRNIPTSGVTLRGAGMWYSVLHGFGAQFKLSGTDNAFHDFALLGDITLRDDTKGYQGFDGPMGSGARVENVWIEHVTAGLWIGHGSAPTPINAPLTDGLVISGARVRDTYADGVNLANATANSIVEQSSFRNNGDDAVATWSFAGDGPLPCANNVFRFNTVQAVWRATCFALYGGKDNRVEDNLCADTSNYPGLFISTTAGFQPLPFSGTTVVQRNTLTRAGGKHYGYDHGALKVFASANGITSPVPVTDIDIIDPVLNGIQLEGSQPIQGVTFDGIAIAHPGTVGVWVTGGVNGSARASGVVVTGATRGLQNDSPSSFTFLRGDGNTGW